MNPLNVLTGGSLMTPAAALRRDDGELVLDRAGDCLLTLDEAAAPRSVTIGHRPGRLVSYNPHAETLDPGCVVLAPPDIKMKAAYEMRQKTGAPVLLVEDGRLVGVIGDEEIYRGILRQPTLAG